MSSRRGEGLEQPQESASQPGSQPPRRSERIRLRGLREAAAQSASTASGASSMANASRAASRPGGRRGTRRSQTSAGSRVRLAAAGLSAPAMPIGSRGLPGLYHFLRTDSRSAPGNPQADPIETSASRAASPTPVAGTSAATGALPSLVPFSLLESLTRPRPEAQAASDHRGVVGRLNRELQDFMREPLDGCQVELVNDNIFKWRATIPGPLETPYEGGTFQLALNFSHDYPFKPPSIYFLTKIYHCNIASTGNICLDILDTEWSPVLTVPKVLLSIISLLSDPNPDDPLEPRIAEVYKRYPEQYVQYARLWTNQYAKPEQDSEDSE